MRKAIPLVVLSMTASLSLPVAASDGFPTCFGREATIVGTSGADVLYGTPAPDVIFGLGGNDMIRVTRRDRVCGGDGDDVILVGPGGHASLSGGAGNDRIKGGTPMVGGPGDDVLTGGTVDFGSAPGPVSVDLRRGKATGDGSDTLSNIWTVFGSRFDDRLTGIAADAWDDGTHLRGRQGDDVLTGTGSYDMLYGGDGNDVLRGAGDSDFLWGGGGDDVLDGGSGLFDQAMYSDAPAGVTVDLSSGEATGDGADVLSGIEAVYGSDHDDTIVGNEKGNYLDGGYDGDDVLHGGDGRDELSGEEGDDALYGEGGNDELWGNYGDDALYGEGGNDELWGEYGSDFLDGGDGMDRLVGSLAFIEEGETDTCVNGEDVTECEA